MAITNYSELKSSIADWLNRADLTAVIPDFITLAEAQFNRQLRTHDMIKRATATVTDDYFSVPLDWLETNVLVNLGTITAPMEYVDYERLNELKGLSLTGDPRFYTMIDGKFLILPAASSEAPANLEMSYVGKIPALSDSNTTNWLLTKSPDLYLYAALMQAEPYLKNDERVGIWATAMQNSMENMRLEGERSKRPSGGLNANRRSFG
jgi:hypothetical protein